MDQATQLRKLALHSAEQTAYGHSASPRLIVVSGGKPGVGTTTLAVNLAVALAGSKDRIALVDASVYRSGVAPLCGLKTERGIADVLSARSTIDEALYPGPSGVLVLAGRGESVKQSEYGATAQSRLLRQIKRMGCRTDTVILDAGSGSNEVVRRYWQAADLVVLLTATDDMSVMDSYAAIKRLSSSDENPPIRIVVNHAPSEMAAMLAFERIAKSCQQFLGHKTELLAHLPHDIQADVSARQATPFVIGAPRSSIATAVGRMAATISGQHGQLDENQPRGDQQMMKVLNST